MNSLNSHFTTSPNGINEECAALLIDDISSPFVLRGIANVGQEYTLSFWAKFESATNPASSGDLNVPNINFSIPTIWVKCVSTFVAESTDIAFNFSGLGTYFVYHAKLEIGNKATDWTPAPEDVDSDIADTAREASEAQQTTGDNKKRIEEAEAAIALMKDAIEMIVTDESGTSILEQTSSGWTFNIKAVQENVESATEKLGELTDDLGSTNAAVDVLNQAVKDLGVLAEYIKIGTYTYTDEDGNVQTEPSIDLGENDTGFKLKITNTKIWFTDGATDLVSINSKNKSLEIEKANIKGELQFGDEENVQAGGVWIWKQRSNGNLGLVWKGVNN